ncbi:hypothetical protein AWENTII_001834 [Aspergillus wentii]
MRMNSHLEMEEAASPDRDPEANANRLLAVRFKNQKPLNTLDVACLIINKIIGGGIFVSSSNVAFLSGNKLVALALWIFGGLYSFCSMYIYLEYGLAWPYNGGEFIYMAKIFPVPPILFATCFAWFFILFATTTNNAITFATFINPDKADNPDEWFTKFVACVIVIAIAILHYRLVNIGILSNNLLAAYKVIFLGVLTIAGFVATCRDGARGRLEGLKDYAHTNGKVSETSIILAILQVLYSYHGWENANYVTSEIEGDAETKKRILKRGALIAIAVVNVLYVLFNLFVFFMLDFDTIIKRETAAVAGTYAVKVFQSGNETMTRHAIYVCIALSAAGNLTGVIFTNARVARDIAKNRLIPFYNFFGMSSGYGISRWDHLGTPTGGLVLHAAITCIYIASIPLFQGDNDEGKQFALTLYTYGHSIISFLLGIGILFLQKRMNEYETKEANPSDHYFPGPWSYQVLKNKRTRYGAVAFFTIVNIFLIALPFKTTNNPDGSTRRIPSWAVPVTVLSVFAFAALVALYIICFVRKLDFQQSRGRKITEFIPYNNRKWIIGYPELRKKRNWIQVFTSLPWEEIRKRLFDNAEARTAAVLREEFQPERRLGSTFPLSGPGMTP